MRLYRLLERHGRLKKRMYPWFDEPAVGFPMKYDGWNWDPAEREWVEADVAEVEVEVQVPAYPKPEETPRPARPLDVPGWYWNGRAGVWEERPMPLERVQQEMERPLAPVGAPHEEDPVRVPGWQWSDSMQEWVKVPVSRRDIAEGRERVPEPRYAPRPELSWRVDGWVWSSTQLKWNESPMPLEWVEVEQERGPKPERPPDLGVPIEAKGWTWSIEFKLWVANTFETAKAIFTPPRSLPPGVNLASVFPADPYFEKSVEMARRLVELGRWDILANGDAYFKLVAQTHKLCPAAKYPHLIAEGVFEARAVMHAKRVWLSSQEAWQMRINALAPKAPDYFGTAGAVLLLGTFCALTGYLIGSIMERLAFVDEDHFVLDEPLDSYLLGPDNWMYSRHIGTSLGGQQFYSQCEDIGTEYHRHKRQRGKFGVDVIDFLGGFLETGFQFPYWVKYVWDYWLIEYIGMLESRGEGFYALKKADYNYKTLRPSGWSAPVSEWCQDFHYYL